MIHNLMNKKDIALFLHDLNHFYRAKVSKNQKPPEPDDDFEVV